MADNEVLVPVVEPPEGMAKLTITFNGQQGDLPDPVSYDSTDGDLKQMATEAIRDGYIPGIDAAEADFADFVVDRFPARDDVPFNRLSLRPKTPFGDIRSEEEIQDVIARAAERSQNTKWPGMTYEEGVEQALLWVIEEIDDNPMQDD